MGGRIGAADGRRPWPSGRWPALLLGLALAACAPTHPPPTATPALPPLTLADITEAQWLRDLDHLRRNLNKVHEYLMYSLAKHREFEDRVRRFRDELPALNPDERMIGLMRVIASLGEPHTRIAFRPKRAFPLEFYWFKEGLFVIGADPGYEDLLHAEVVGLGPAAVASVISTLGEIIPHENEWRLKDRAPIYLSFAEILHGLKLIPDPEEAGFVFRDLEGRTFEAVVNARPFGDGRPPRAAAAAAPLYLSHPDKFYWFHYLQDRRTVFFKYNSCHDMPGHPFSNFLSELLVFIRSHEVDRIVVDLRHNSGGYPQLLGPFIRTMARIKRAGRGGTLHVAVGRRTFSAAVLNALDLRRTAQAILVGEPTGGKPSHYGDIRFFSLPFSRLNVSYPTQYIWREGVLAESVAPDHLVEPSIHDWIAGRDPVLEGLLRGDFDPGRAGENF